jgi:hypothetical protein
MDMSGQLHALVTLPALKDSYLHTPLVPLNIRVGTPQSRFGRFELEKTLFPLLWMEPQFLGYPFGSLINIPTTLARLLFIHHTSVRRCLHFSLQFRVVHDDKLCDVSARMWKADITCSLIVVV